MYDRSERFKRLYSCTSTKIGPATYFLPETFTTNAKYSSVAFNTSSIRKSAFENKNAHTIPSANEYNVRFRKKRIIGGTSMQNKAPRVKKKTETVKELYPVKIAKQIRGHIYFGVAPRDESRRITTIPEKGALGYELLDSGPVKMYAPLDNMPVGPMTYYNPEGGKCFTTMRYGGPCWSTWSAPRFKEKDSDGPGPAAYSVNQIFSTGQKYKNKSQTTLQDTSPLMRTNELLFRKLCKENLPGPGSYSITDDNIKKKSFGKRGTFSMAERQSLFKTSETPGPSDYTMTTAPGHSVSVGQAPFDVEADRFPDVGSAGLPGPSDYNPRVGLWNDLQKRVHSKYSVGPAPFDSSAVRKMSMTKADSSCTPGPDWYLPQFLSKGMNQSTMLMADRSPEKHTQTSPGPAAYSVMEPFKGIHNQKSHLHNDHSAFLTSSDRLHDPGSSDLAPNTYNIPSTTLDKKGFTICGKPKDSKSEVTPGPPDYQHSLSGSRTLHTHNVSLKPRQPRASNLANIGRTKKLRSFLNSKYEHCPIMCA